MSDKDTITVAGVTFSADDVVSAVLRIEDREVHIGEREEKPNTIGFKGAHHEED